MINAVADDLPSLVLTFEISYFSQTKQEVPDFFIPQVSPLSSIGAPGSHLTRFKGGELSPIYGEEGYDHHAFQEFSCDPQQFLCNSVQSVKEINFFSFSFCQTAAMSYLI